MSSAVSALNRPAEEYGNSADVEMRWAINAYHHAETYFSLITSVDPRLLRLTQLDDEIYAHFKKEFPDLQLNILDQSIIKSKEGKELWRPFCETYKERIDDYNMGTLIRTDCIKDYSEDNTFIVPRIQFCALEIARNREGLNNNVHNNKSKGKDDAS